MQLDTDNLEEVYSQKKIRIRHDGPISGAVSLGVGLDMYLWHSAYLNRVNGEILTPEENIQRLDAFYRVSRYMGDGRARVQYPYDFHEDVGGFRRTVFKNGCVILEPIFLVREGLPPL